MMAGKSRYKLLQCAAPVLNFVVGLQEDFTHSGSSSTQLTGPGLHDCEQHLVIVQVPDGASQDLPIQIMHPGAYTRMWLLCSFRSSSVPSDFILAHLWGLHCMVT